MFPEDLFAYVLIDLAEAVAGYKPPTMQLELGAADDPGALSVHIRHGDLSAAHEALAILLSRRPAQVWPTLVGVAVEEVGVGDMDVVARTAAAAQDPGWRRAHGGDWRVAALLVQQMVSANRSRAGRELIDRLTTAPGLQLLRARLLDSSKRELAGMIGDLAAPLDYRALAALALGGGLLEGQPHSDPEAVFHELMATGRSTHVVATCQAAWRLSRRWPSLVLPLIWRTAVE